MLLRHSLMAPPFLSFLLLALSLRSGLGAMRRASSCVSVRFGMRVTDGVCDRRRSVVFSETRPLVNFDDKLPSAACNLSVLVPPGKGLFSRLRYLGVRIFHPTPAELDDLRLRRGLCLEVAFSIRSLHTSALQSPSIMTTTVSKSESFTTPSPTPGPVLREQRGCVSTRKQEDAWIFQELPRSLSNQSHPPTGGLVAEFAWQLIRQPGIAASGVSSSSDSAPLRLAFSVAPYFDCTGAAEPGRFVHCQGGSEDLCVPKSLACCSPVVNYLECPKRALFTSSIMECALANPDVGFYLFLVVAGTSAVSAVMLCLLVQPIVALAKRGKVV